MEVTDLQWTEREIEREEHHAIVSFPFFLPDPRPSFSVGAYIRRPWEAGKQTQIAARGRIN